MPSLTQKGKGALVHLESELRDENDELYYIVHAGAFAVGAHSFVASGKPPASLTPEVEVPKRAPDAICEERVGQQQAQIYRLSGDYNPLHIDPEIAEMSGFEQPILHGLCTLGFAVRIVLTHFAEGNESEEFRAVRCRFVGTVSPGETLRIKMWINGSKLIFTTEVVERSKLVIANAFVELRSPPAVGQSIAAKL